MLGKNQRRIDLQLLLAGASPLAVQERAGGNVRINEVNGNIGTGPIKIVHVNLEPIEIQIWRN